MDAIVFYASGVISILAALLVVTRKNPVYGAIFLVLFFTTVSLDFFILHASFLAVIQVLVYAGAIMVLYLFVIMLLSLKPEQLKEEVSPARKAGALLVSGALFFLLVRAIRLSDLVNASGDLSGNSSPGLAGMGTIEAVGDELFTHQVLPFELASILITAAIIGAVYLTKRPQIAASERTTAAAGGRDPAGPPPPPDRLSRPAAPVKEAVR